MTRSLRKNCSSCTVAKRRCTIQLPKCQRCRNRQIECVYDLEPLVDTLTTARRRPGHIEAAKKDVQPSDCPSERFLNYISSLHMDANMVAIRSSGALRGYHTTLFSVPVSSDPVTTEYLVTELRQLPAVVLDGVPSTFVHVRMQADVWRRLDLLKESSQDTRFPENQFDQPTDSGRRRVLRLLSQLDVREGSLLETLNNFQALLLFAVPFLFSSEPSELHHGHPLIQSMKRVANDLVSYAPSQMPADLPAWETWVLAESVRRSILMVYLIRGAHSSWVRGYCKHELFTEALPLDARGGLWTAECRSQWEARLGSSGEGAGAGRANNQLSSFHDFNSAFAKTPFDPGPDSYLRLLLIAHHGKTAMDRISSLGCLKLRS